MRPISVALLLVLWSALALCSKLCDPTAYSIIPFTGFRIYRRVVYGWPIRHNWQLLHCDSGKVDFMQYYSANRTGDFPWKTPLCLSKDLCYVVARRKRYALRRIPVYARNTLIGGLYKCDSPSNCSNPVPILPLYSDTSISSFKMREGLKLVKYAPFLYTPETSSLRYPRIIQIDGNPKWAKEVDVNEQYQYSRLDRLSPWYQMNILMNTLGEHLIVNDDLLPWEFDAAAKDMGA